MSTLALKFDDPFKRFIIFSVAAHVVTVLAFSISSFISSSDEIIIRNSIRVDMVALPDKVIPKIKTIVKVKPKPVKLNKVNPKKQLNAFEKLKQLEQKDALKKLKQLNTKKEKPTPKNEDPIPKPDAKPIVNKGNVISDAGDLNGLDRIQMERYYADLKQHIMENWSLPQWLEDQNLKAQALVQIDERGFVVNTQITASSNNDIFDTTVINTIKSASPFPAPPARLSNTLKNQGFTLGFPI